MIKIYHYQSDVCARLALQLAQLYLGSHPRLQFQVRAESLQAATRLFSNCYRLSEPLVKSVYKILRSDSGFIHAPQTKIHVMQVALVRWKISGHVYPTPHLHTIVRTALSRRASKLVFITVPFGAATQH